MWFILNKSTPQIQFIPANPAASNQVTEENHREQLMLRYWAPAGKYEIIDNSVCDATNFDFIQHLTLLKEPDTTDAC